MRNISERYIFSNSALKYREDALPSKKAKIPLGHSRYRGNWVDLLHIRYELNNSIPRLTKPILL